MKLCSHSQEKGKFLRNAFISTSTVFIVDATITHEEHPYRAMAAAVLPLLTQSAQYLLQNHTIWSRPARLINEGLPIALQTLTPCVCIAQSQTQEEIPIYYPISALTHLCLLPLTAGDLLGKIEKSKEDEEEEIVKLDSIQDQLKKLELIDEEIQKVGFQINDGMI